MASSRSTVLADSSCLPSLLSLMEYGPDRSSALIVPSHQLPYISSTRIGLQLGFQS
jgi:hypothetical protein